MTRHKLTCGILMLAWVVGCSGQNDALTWEEFQKHVTHEKDTGMYIVDGDEPVDNLEDLRTYYDEHVAPQTELGDDISTIEQPLIVNTVNGKDDKWSNANADNLTYCVSSSSFGSHYNAVVSALATAASAWQATADVHFKHVTSKDSSCSHTTTGVIFNVRQVTGQTFLARSFLPSFARASRELLIDSSSFGSIAPITLAGILRHELGHTIGFRHEHIRPEAGGVCPETNNWRALTTYDSASVMHYPQCNGTNTGDLVLTTKDKAGARLLYCAGHAIACGSHCCTTNAKVCGTGGQCCDGVTCTPGCPC